MNRWLYACIGRIWILKSLDDNTFNKTHMIFSGFHTPELRERGLIEPSFRIVGGWQITDKVRKALGDALK